MTDWLDEILDRDTPESVPEGFLERVIAQAQVEEVPAQHQAGGRLISFPQLMSMTAAAVMLLAVGFWLGQGGDTLHAPAVLGNGPENAMLDLDELYQNREVLEAYEVLADDDLNSAFYDAETGTWALDYSIEDQPR